MKKGISLFTILILVFMINSCGNMKKEKEQTKADTETTVADITYGWAVTLSPTLDTTAFAKHSAQHPQRWEAVFTYLRDTDLETLAIGEHEILGREVYAIVSEYEPKEEADCNFEAHRKYIDLQYLIRGEEKMGVTLMDKVVPIGEYDEQKDIIFFSPDAPAIYEVATPDVFYLFFPENVHRPSIKNKEDSRVKKIVVKIMV